MDANRFDTIAKRFAGGRLSRRQALRQGGAGLAAGALAAAGFARPSAAQNASPVASPAAGAGASAVFVQLFDSGTFRPKPGEPGVYTLALNHSSAQTIAFSDGPRRAVGAIPTSRFLPQSDVALADPPNAALVTRAADGVEDVLVVELIKPSYDEATGFLTYDVRVLENYAEAALSFLAERQTDLTAPEQFGQASLFIDNCPDGSVKCVDCQSGNDIGSFDGVPMCYSDACCGPCESHDRGHWQDKCNQAFLDCGPVGCDVSLEGTLVPCLAPCNEG